MSKHTYFCFPQLLALLQCESDTLEMKTKVVQVYLRLICVLCGNIRNKCKNSILLFPKTKELLIEEV